MEDDPMQELRSIASTVDAPRRPLGLDKMFLRARNWKPAGPSAPLRPPTPEIIPLPPPMPLPEVDANGVSPMSQVFEYADLAPLVLEEITNPKDMARMCRVCKEWNHMLRRRLYRDVWVRPWEEAPKPKLLGLFDTLARYPELCKQVRSLDIRFFPLDIQGEQRILLEDKIEKALGDMENLERLVWTRDRSLTSALFRTITGLPSLRSLELSGHSQMHFDPGMIGRMSALRELRVMMPDQQFRMALLEIAAALDRRPIGGLGSLGIICKSVPFLNDEWMAKIAPHMRLLEKFTLIGRTRITRTGVYHLLDAAPGLKELVLDAPPHSGLMDLSAAPDLEHLHTFSLSFEPHVKPDPRHPTRRIILEPADLPLLRHTESLRALELTISAPKDGIQRSYVLSPHSLDALMAQVNFSALTRLALLNIVVPLDVLTAVLDNTTLQELYIKVASHETLTECDALLRAPLQVLHANAPAQFAPTRVHLGLLAASMPLVEEIGSMNRVFEVHRRWLGEERVVELVRWSQVYTPRYFQVWRP